MIISKKYEVLSQLGEGGMGVVYKVRHTALETVNALKALPTHFGDNPELVKRFYREARLLARLKHPNIVRVIDIERDEELKYYYFVMEYIEGRTVRDHLRECGPLDIAQVLTIAKQVAGALHYAHHYDPPVIHRDIKPTNIMIEDGSQRVVVMDFGIAKDLGEIDMTRVGTMLGTLRYAPPEQLRHEALDGSADIYALGMVMCEALVGSHPFADLAEYTVFARVASPEEHDFAYPPGTPASFAALVSKAIRKDRSQRYRTMAELIVDIDACSVELGETTPGALPTPGPGRGPAGMPGEPTEVAAVVRENNILGLSEQRRRQQIRRLEAQVAEHKAIALRQGAAELVPDLFTAACAAEDLAHAQVQGNQFGSACRSLEEAIAGFKEASEAAASRSDEHTGEILLTATRSRESPAEDSGPIRPMPEAPQAANVRQHLLGRDPSASRAPPDDRTSTTGAEPGGGRQQSHPNDIGKYHIILPPMSEGRVGPLYKAYDQVSNRLVALKVIFNDPSVAAVEQDRFFRAGRLWTRLDHPNVVRIYDYNSQSDARFIVMELLEGMDLGHYIDSRRSLSLADKLSIILQVCNGLNHIHGHGIVHRDIRPTNIFLSNQLLVKILESHITREADPRKDHLTVVGQVLGDPKYIAPEQILGNPWYSSDIFSVGALLCDLLTYKVPAGSDPRERIHALGSARPSIPKELVNIVEQALSPDPAQRLSDLDEMESRIEQVRRNLPGNVSRRADPKTPCPRVVFTLHGIRTHAAWQRAFAEVAANENWRCRLDRWNFGYFSLLRFLLPWQRRTRVAWFRSTYHDESKDRNLQLDKSNRPCIVAHSFGTYILGNALLSYDYLRFDKIILCGSILPTNFPWHELIDRGQVQAVRNEYGTRDFWTGIVSWFVRGAGPSGIHGFTCTHERLEQKRFLFSHSEYFETGHMTHNWVPFLNRELPDIPARDLSPSVGKSNMPWALYLIYSIAFCLAVFFSVKGVWAP